MCNYPDCIMQQCFHGVNGEPHCQRRKPNHQPDYKKIIGLIILIAIWGFITYIIQNIN